MSSEKIEAVISDFGGVLTSPLLDSFMAFQHSSGISLEDLGTAMRALSHELGTNPLFELETGRMTEARFLELLSSQLSSSSVARWRSTGSASSISSTCTRMSR